MTGNRPVCQETGKVIFRSVGDARSSLTGGLRSKRVRVYTCLHNRGHYHLTKEKSTTLR